jgi:hypothetical protein
MHASWSQEIEAWRTHASPITPLTTPPQNKLCPHDILFPLLLSSSDFQMKFGTLNKFKEKCYQLQTSITFRGLQIWLWSFLRLWSFDKFQFQLRVKFKRNFPWIDGFKWKSRSMWDSDDGLSKCDVVSAWLCKRVMFVVSVISGWWCGLCGVIAVVQFNYRMLQWYRVMVRDSVVRCELMSQSNQPLSIVALSYSLVRISLFNLIYSLPGWF